MRRFCHSIARLGASPVQSPPLSAREVSLNRALALVLVFTAACSGSVAGGSSTASTSGGTLGGAVGNTTSATHGSVTAAATGSIGSVAATGAGSSGHASSGTTHSSATSTGGSGTSSIFATTGSTSSTSTATGTTGGGTCGAANFDLVCQGSTGGDYTCPANGTCTASGGCGCAGGYLDVNCAGEPCNGNCVYPDWWCAPREAGACGAANFSVPCSDGNGGTVYCPSTSTCDGTTSCTCAAGEVAMTCGGELCSSSNPCSYPDWWCAAPSGATSTSGTTGASGSTGTQCPLPQGTTGSTAICGMANFVSPCELDDGQTTYCPSNATCGSGGGCYCPLGYSAQTCSGDSCNGGGCNYPNWWCAPDAPPTAPGSLSNGTCATCTLGSSSCSGGGTCIPVRPGSTLGICAVDCDSTALTCADSHSTCVDPNTNTALCYPWACLGLGEAAPSCGIAHEPWPQVPNQGAGGVSSVAAEIITFAPWDGGSYPYQAAMESWAQNVMASSYPVTASGEYGIQSASYAGAVHLTTPPPEVLYDSDLQAAAANLIAHNVVPYAPGTVLIFFIPASTTYYRDSANTEQLCTAQVGYHASTTYNGQPVLYAVIGDCGGAATFALDDLQSVMAATSHEIIEAATDPVNETGWGYPYPFPHADPWANEGGEIADMCDWDTESNDSQGDIVQRVFSNAAARQGGDPCVPAVSQPAAAVTSLPYSVFTTPGAQVTVPLIGWSTNPSTVSWVQLDYLSDLSVNLPPSLPLNALVPLTITAPATSGSVLVNLVASAPGASFTEWPIYLEAY